MESNVEGLSLYREVLEFIIEARDNIVKRLFKKRILVLPAGIKSIRIMPPLIINEDEAAKGISLINEALVQYNK